MRNLLPSASPPRRCETCKCLPVDWLKIASVARVLAVHRTTVQRMIKDGRLAGVRFGRVLRVRHEGRDANGSPGLHEYLAECEEK